MTEKEIDAFMEEIEREHAPFEVEQTWSFREFLLKFEKVVFGYEYFSVTDGGERAIRLCDKDNHWVVVFNLSEFSEDCIIKEPENFIVEKRKSGHYILCYEQIDKQVMEGTIEFENGDVYIGSLKENKPYGWGKYKYSNGHSHKGYFDVIPSGIGYHNMDYHMEIGNFRDGLLNGWGIRYLYKEFQFGFWEDGQLVIDETKSTLWIRQIISDDRVYYHGNLVQIDKNHNYIRLGIPEKTINIGCNFPNPPKLPSFGFMFFKDGTVKVGEIKNENSGFYIQYNTDGTRNLGHWKNGLIICPKVFSDFQKPKEYYEVDGLDVYEKTMPSKFDSCPTISKEQPSDSTPNNVNPVVVSYSPDGKELISVVGESINSFDIQDGTEKLCEFVFSRCKGLVDITIPESVTNIEQYAFAGCKDLKSVTLCSSIASISIGMFSGCESLESIILPYGITTINDEAFKNCKHLKKIILPGSVTSIGKEVFSNCDNLQSIFIPTGTFGDFASILKDYLSLVKEYKTSKDEDVRALDNILNGKMDEQGVLYSSDWSILYFNTKPLGSYVVKDGILGISTGAFQPFDWKHDEGTSLKRLELPTTGVLGIGGAAFANNKELEYINIPKDAFFLCEDNPFAGCDKLKTIKWDCERFVKEGTLIFNKEHTVLFSCLCSHYESWVLKGWTLLSFARIHGRMQVGFFVDKKNGNLCRKCLFTNKDGIQTYVSFGLYLENITVEEIVASKNDLFVVQMESGRYLLHKKREVMAEQDKVVVLPDGLKRIAANAFYGNTTLERIYLPKSLEYVGENAFLGCSSLKQVFVPYGEKERFIRMLPKLKKIIDNDLPF